jgi:hypothetical protein
MGLIAMSNGNLAVVQNRTAAVRQASRRGFDLDI